MSEMTVFEEKKKDEFRYYDHPLPPPITHDSVGAGMRGGAQKNSDCNIDEKFFMSNIRFLTVIGQMTDCGFRLFGKQNLSIQSELINTILMES